jgi:hypothetical protein
MKAKQSDDVCQSEYACFLFCTFYFEDNNGRMDVVVLASGPASDDGLYWYRNNGDFVGSSYGFLPSFSTGSDRLRVTFYTGAPANYRVGQYLSLGDVNNGMHKPYKLGSDPRSKHMGVIIACMRACFVR